MKPRACVLKAAGTNCDAETDRALTAAGAMSRIVHVNELRHGHDKLSRYDLLVIPGGFSYGDDVASGAILAVELMTFLREQLEEFATAGKPIVGICNGFQVLARSGLLPFGKIGEPKAALLDNDSGRFECRWVRLKVGVSPCQFLNGLPDEIELPVAHGEGRFFVGPAAAFEMSLSWLVPLRYSDGGEATEAYPQNPNGSERGVAAACSPTGRILGLMPHPERFTELWQHPNWRRRSDLVPFGRIFFKNLVQAST